MPDHQLTDLEKAYAAKCSEIEMLVAKVTALTKEIAIIELKLETSGVPSRTRGELLKAAQYWEAQSCPMAAARYRKRAENMTD